MNKFNKGKLLGVVAASLSAVSLMGVGFATWIIGAQKTDVEQDITITADTVEYKSLKVAVVFEGALKLAETGTTKDTSKNFGYDGKGAGNLEVKAHFTFTFGKDFKEADFTELCSKINFTILSPGGNYKDNKVEKGNAFTRADNATAESKYTYFAAPEAVGITWGDITFPEKIDAKALTKESNVVDKTVTFTWGTLFGGTNPMAYYNGQLESVTGENIEAAKETYMQNAYKELKAMNEKYSTGSQIKMKMELVR